MIVGEERTHEELKAVTREYGPYLVDLIVAKKREVEKYCPSGGYPTPILWERGQELAVSEVITRLISAIPKTKGRARAPHVSKPISCHRPAATAPLYLRPCPVAVAVRLFFIL